MLKAFLSHSSVDKTIIRKIKNKIQRFWTYFDEDCFEPGEDFRNAIIKRLEDTNLFVLFVSRNSLASSWVQFEIDEAYWQTIQRKNIQFLVLFLEDIPLNELPEWMRHAKIESVRTVDIAAQLIKNLLLKSISLQQTIYMGREKDTLEFYNKIVDYTDHYPNIFAVTGLNGVGRKTFIMKILAQRFSLPLFSQFEIAATDGPLELYRKILDENPENLSSDKINEYYQSFMHAPTTVQAKELARILAIFSNMQTCPILIDCGGMLNDDGYYRDDFLTLLKEFSFSYQDHYLAVIHTRRPKLPTISQNLLLMTKLQALDSNSCYSLFDALLKKHNVPIPDPAQVKEIAKYLEGYPPAILYAVQECILDGVDLVYNDKRSLVDFQERTFSEYIGKLPLEETDLTILAIIYNMENILIEPLVTISGFDRDVVVQSLRKSLDFNIIELCPNGTYSIAPPIKIPMARKLHHYDKNEFSKISACLIKNFWEAEKPISSFVLLDIIIYAILRSGHENDINDFRSYLLPSHLLKAAEKANENRDWPLMEQYARRVLELDKESVNAKSILFRALVRQEYNNPTFIEEENVLLESLYASHYKSAYYLDGFRLWKRRNYNTAIRKFQLAIQSGDTSIPTYRDLAECYYQINKVVEAQNVIQVIMKSRRINNPFILDLAAKIAISTEDFGRAEDILRRQEFVDRPENVSHRWATYYMKKGEYSKALDCANQACSGERVLPEMHLLRMTIAIHEANYQLVTQEYNYIAENYSHYNHDVREVLYTTMLLQTQGWKNAEAGYQKIHNKNNPYVEHLRYKIVCAELADDMVSTFQKSSLLKEKEQLETKKLFDPLHQFQCYDFQ